MLMRVIFQLGLVCIIIKTEAWLEGKAEESSQKMRNLWSFY